MSLTPLTLTGVSTFSSDLQAILTRQVQIASLPLKALQNQDADVLQKKTLVNGLQGPISALGAAVTALGTLASNRALSATSSDPTKVSVQVTGATSPTNYAITNITSIAAAASETSITGYANSGSTPVSATGKVRLVVGSQNYDFTLTNNNLTSLRDQINGLGAGVTASILTTGQNNYLAVSANSTGQTTLKLIDDPTGAKTSLLTTNNQGSNAVFKLNGVNISRSSNTVNDVVGGLTFQILGTTAEDQTVNLSLGSDRSQLSNAIANFVARYNTVADSINGQSGPGSGLLSGDFLVRQVRNDLHALTTYQTSGTIQSLADLGLNFDTTGKLSFDSSKFSSLSDSQVAGAFQFFGSAQNGFGALASKFSEITDPITGLIKVQSDGYTAADQRLQATIAATTDRISQLQKATAARLQVADSLLAQLQSQQQTVTSSIASLNYILYGKQTGN